MQAEPSRTERMKILYALSVHVAEAWHKSGQPNETMAVHNWDIQMQTLDIFWRTSKRLFGDLDQAQMAHDSSMSSR